ncbi:ABC transporter substrate-binding protein [Pseudomonas sp. 2FE]|uniref:substrate-binding periplasmic protein n=1 Tax=Pseudomonas sp. 2FE TaxID=2502190 RepID=UPI0010F93239|nr:transporter substrate-binding domain-containing protein [Pseudomonas sp. 2FE]
MGLSRGIALWAALCSCCAVNAEPLRLVADTWPPFTDASLPNNGLASDLVSAVLQRAGYSSEYIEVPWARALRGLQAGDYDVALGAWYDAQRAQYGLFSEAYLVNRIRFLQRKGADIQFDQLEDLRPYRIATVRGYAYQAQFDQDARLHKVPVMGFAMGARMLAAGRVQLTLEDELVARYYLKGELHALQGQLEFLPKPLSENGLHILVRRSHPQHRQIVAAFNRALREMRADGSYAQIFQRHGF